MPITLLELPTEIRDEIWSLVFKDQLVVPMPGRATFRQVGCLGCLNEHHINPIPWTEVFRPLLTCRQIHDEAAPVLYNSFQAHLGKNVFLTDSPRPPFVGINTKVTSAVIWVHIGDENRVQWTDGLESIGHTFPNLRQLTIKAHMRPPNSYEVLIDAIALSIPMVRYTRDKRDMEVTMCFDYTYDDIMFDSPYLGEIRTTDALEEHELVIRDLIEDDAFVEAALSEDEDEEAMVAALLRTARAHEQQWFQKLQRTRAARHRTEQEVLPPSEGPSSPAESTVDSTDK